MELVVVGLDGLSTNMLNRFDIDIQYIPTVLKEGVSGELLSVDTPTTLPAWTSFATGKDPGSHGITNMITQAPDYETSPVQTNTTDAALYDLIDDAVFINLPGSAGREPVAEDTHLVSAMLAQDKDDAVPPHLQELDSFENYVLDHDKSLKSNPDRYFDHVCDITRARRNFAIEAFETYEPRIGFVLFSTPDWAGHLLSNFSDEVTRASYYQELLEVVDDCTEDVADLADNVVLMSDHGFERKHTNVHINDYLREMDYLRETDARPTVSSTIVGIGKSLGKRSAFLYEKMRQVYNYIIATDVGQQLQSAAEPDIDYQHSEAWQLRYGCIFFNDERFDHPTVEDPSRIRNQLREELRTLTDSAGNQLFRDVLLPEEAYEHPGQWTPDIIARPEQGCYPTMLESPTGGYASETNNYNHRYRGLIAASGPLFKSRAEIEGASIIDVVPTILVALDTPLSPNFDGSCLQDVFANEVSPQYLPDTAVPEPRFQEIHDRGDTNREKAVEDRLEDLGYLE